MSKQTKKLKCLNCGKATTNLMVGFNEKTNLEVLVPECDDCVSKALQSAFDEELKIINKKPNKKIVRNIKEATNGK